MRGPRRPGAPGRLTAVLVAAVVLFSAHDLWAHHTAARELATLRDAVERTVPGVVDLVELRSVGGVLRRTVRQASEQATSPVTSNRAGDIAHDLDVRFAQYAQRPMDDGGAIELRSKIGADLDEIHAALADLFAAPDQPSRQRRYDERFVPCLEKFSREVGILIEASAREASRTAADVAAHDARSETYSLVLLAVLALVVVAVGLAVHRTLTLARAEEQRRLEELDAFAARVAHDLRGPLNPIALAIGLLEHNEALTDGQRRSLAAAQRSVSRMVALIDGLLRFARAGARPEPGSVVRVDLVAQEQVAAVQGLAAQERAEVTAELESGLEAATSEPVLQSILENLLRNALLHLGDAPLRRVTVRARGDGSEVVLQVADTGPGIAPEVAGQLFRPFARASDRPGGHGLGLATVKRLADSHGGSVVLESAIGQGSTFEVRLPRVRRPGSVSLSGAGVSLGVDPM